MGKRTLEEWSGGEKSENNRLELNTRTFFPLKVYSEGVCGKLRAAYVFGLQKFQGRFDICQAMNPLHLITHFRVLHMGKKNEWTERSNKLSDLVGVVVGGKLNHKYGYQLQLLSS